MIADDHFFYILFKYPKFLILQTKTDDQSEKKSSDHRIERATGAIVKIY